MDHHVEVNGLSLPPQLVRMLATGQWRHPGDDLVRILVPFLDGPVDFLQVDAMRRESCLSLPDHPWVSDLYRIARNTSLIIPAELPWLDADQAVFIAICRFSGDDLAIALDYRTGADDPRVVANEWLPGLGGCLWNEVAGTFSGFARRLGLDL